MSEAARRDEAFRSALARLPMAVVIVDSQQRFQAYNARAAELFESEGLRGDLMESRPAHPLSAFVRAIVESGVEPQEETIAFPSGRRYRVEPSRRSDKGKGRWLLLLVSPAATDAQVDFSMLGLTPRERAVAEQLLRGAGTREICEALEISRDTLKTHLKRLYEKSGTTTRASFVAKMLQSRGSIQ